MSRSIVRAGEIFGVAGVAGNGQNELLSAMSGETLAPSAEAIMLAGEAVGRLGVTERRNLGFCAVPEERNGHAAVGEFSLTDNGSLTGRDRMEMVRFGLIDPAKATNYAAEVIGAFTVKATGPGALAGSLSGGNLQKFIMGREILQRPEALVVCQPTWGVDAGAAAAIHQAIVDLAARGSAVMVISQDLDELSDALRHDRGHQSRPPVEADEGRRGFDRGDRAADGRRARRPDGDGRNDRGSACASDLKSG